MEIKLIVDAVTGEGELHIPYYLHLVHIISDKHFVHTFPVGPFQFIHLSLKIEIPITNLYIFLLDFNFLSPYKKDFEAFLFFFLASLLFL